MSLSLKEHEHAQTLNGQDHEQTLHDKCFMSCLNTGTRHCLTRKLSAAMTVEGDVPDYMNKTNVKRVLSVLNETAWDYLFPIRDKLYEFDGFLHAVGKFQAFCNESNLTADYTPEQACARELSTLFAHFA